LPVLTPQVGTHDALGAAANHPLAQLVGPVLSKYKWSPHVLAGVVSAEADKEGNDL